MVDGSAALTTHLHGLRAAGLWGGERGENMLDGGAPFYDTYETADGKYVAVGAIEQRFWRDLVTVLGLDPDELPPHIDVNEWSELRETLAGEISRSTRAELVERAAGTDACPPPVLSPAGAPARPR